MQNAGDILALCCRPVLYTV